VYVRAVTGSCRAEIFSIAKKKERKKERICSQLAAKGNKGKPDVLFSRVR
jgi:hypothetical protein